MFGLKLAMCHFTLARVTLAVARERRVALVKFFCEIRNLEINYRHTRKWTISTVAMESKVQVPSMSLSSGSANDYAETQAWLRPAYRE